MKILFLVLMLGLTMPTYSQRVNQDTVISTNICFYVSTDNIVKNDPGYNRYINEMLPFMYDNINNLDSVVIRGAASPEGTVEFNEHLSHIRAEKISKDLHFSKYMSNVIYAGADYTRLYELLDSALLKDVKEAFASDNPKAAIRKLPKYRYLLDEIYPQLRSTQVTMYFSEKDPCFTDTVYISQLLTDTIYDYRSDTVWLEKPFRKIPILALKTNLATDLLAAPTFSAEIYTHLWGISLEAEYMVPWYHDDRIYFYYQIADGIVGMRKYIKDDYTGHWFGIYGHSVLYDICLNEEDGWQGEGWGFGISYGYDWRSKKHPRWRFEPYIRIGYFHSNFDTYHAGDPFQGKYYYDWYKKASDFVPRRFDLNYIGPTMLGLNISFDALCIRRY